MKIPACLYCALLLSIPVYGTGPGNLEEQIEYQLDSLAFQESAIASAKDAADTIFTGIATEIWKDHALRRVYVRFEVLEVHRGYPGSSVGYYDETNSARRLQFDSDPICPSNEECAAALSSVRVCVGCLPSHDKVQPFEETFRYLAYLDGNRIIRQNEYRDWVVPMTAAEELEFIEDQ